jgi:hypothetical protein
VRYILNVVVFIAFLMPVALRAQASSPISEHPFVVEYYYKAKWGHADEFLKLFKKNHYPLVTKEVDEDAVKKQLWRDQETYTREEQRRFEILDAHWDLPIRSVDLDKP